MIMTVDIGGTKTLCAFWKDGKLLEERKFSTTSITNFNKLFSELMTGKTIDCLCFALAGPVADDSFKLTNTGQELHLQNLRKAFADIPHIAFLNDLEALGYAISSLDQSQLCLFKEGTACKGVKAVLSIGTGLGISAVTKEGVVLPSEGGHIEFSPQNEQQARIHEYLKQRYGHVSCERLLSGQGLVNIYAGLTGNNSLRAEQVTERAFAGEPSAVETLRVFSSILGTACSSYALLFMATGGIYLGGGIIPKVLPLLDKAVFEYAYLQKGRLKDFVAQVPVFVILDEKAPSQGACIYGEALTAGL